MNNDKKHNRLRHKHGLGGGRKKGGKTGISRYIRRRARRILKAIIGK